MAVRLGSDALTLSDIWPKDQCAVLYDLAKRYPGKDVDLPFGKSTIRILQSAGSFNHILRGKPDSYDKALGAFTQLIGPSRLSADGEKWRYLRDISNRDITRVDPNSIIAAVREPFEEAAMTMAYKASAGPAADIDVSHVIDRAAAVSVCQGLLGFPEEIYSDDMLGDIIHLARLARVLNYGGLGYDQAEFSRLEEEAKAADGRISARLDQLGRQKQVEGIDTEQLFDRILTDRSGQIDQRGEILTLYAAGFETTAASVGWSLFLLSNDQSLQEILRAEILEKLGESDLNLDGLMQCGKLRAFLAECLRIFPTLPMIGRKATEADDLNGSPVAKGQLVLGSIIGLHMNPQTYTKPSQVDLQRFPSGDVPKALAPHYLPFSDGRRVCPGSRFAHYETLCALSILLRRIRFQPATKRPLLFDWVFTLRRMGGQSFKLEPLS